MAQYTIDNINAPIDFQENNQIKRALQNAKNLLMTRMGEVPYDRFRGFDYGLFDLPITQFEAALLPELDRIMAWEPDISVVSADTEVQDNGEIRIIATVECRITETGG